MSEPNDNKKVSDELLALLRNAVQRSDAAAHTAHLMAQVKETILQDVGQQYGLTEGQGVDLKTGLIIEGDNHEQRIKP